MKYAICCLGCKVNLYEAESTAEEMDRRGWQRVPFEEKADAVLVFTCAVTNTAAAKSRKMLHRARRSAPEGAIVLVGCYVQVDDGKLADADILVGTSHKKEIPDLIERFLTDRKPIKAVTALDAIPYDNLRSENFSGRTRAFLKVQDGCDQYCSYCVIPYTRGHQRSMEPDAAVAAAKALARTHKEIVLTGIHTGRYGREHGVTLAQLAERILQETDILRLRISSIEITEVDDRLLDLLANDERVARHLHIPLQAGSDSVLAKMHRPYTTQQYLQSIQKIRERVPGISISTDLITGFPQESEEDFAETVEFLKKCEFSFLHVFPFSLRSGTEAEKMSGHLSEAVKKQRAAVCLQLSDELQRSMMHSWIGKEAAVITETAKDGHTTGYTSEYIPVVLDGHLPSSQYVRVRLSEVTDDLRMKGEIL